jgi:hypothetical protein
MKKIGILLLIILFGLGACARSENEKKDKKEKITQVKKMEKQQQITEEFDTTEEIISDEDSVYSDSLY